MSNYSSIIFVWDQFAAEEAIGRGAYTREAIEQALHGLGTRGDVFRVRDVQLFLGLPLDEPMCCEDGARLCINHLNPNDFWAAVDADAPWLYSADAQAWWKEEGADRYSEIVRPTEQPSP